MTWDKQLFLYVCLPMLLLAGITFAIHQVTAPSLDTMDEVQTQNPSDGDPGGTSVPQREPEMPPAPGSWPWLSMVFATVAAVSSSIIICDRVLHAVIRWRRRRKS